MAKYIHIPILGRGDLGLCGCHTYHLIHGFVVKNKDYWNGKLVCPKCKNVGKKFPEKVHFWKPFKNREDMVNYLKQVVQAGFAKKKVKEQNLTNRSSPYGLNSTLCRFECGEKA